MEAKAAAGDDGDRNRFRQGARAFEIQTLQQAVTTDIGVDDGGDAGVLEALRKLERGQFRDLSPALYRDVTALGVDADGDLSWKRLRCGLDEIRVANRSRAEDDPGNPTPQPAFDRGHVADAAAELNRDRNAVEHALDRLQVHGGARERTVEIDDMHPFEARILEAARHRRRVGAVDGRLIHVALLQPDDLALFEIDGGIKDHGVHLIKLRIRVSPRVWLFSGWNWVPATLSRATMAVTGPP